MTTNNDSAAKKHTISDETAEQIQKCFGVLHQILLTHPDFQSFKIPDNVAKLGIEEYVLVAQESLRSYKGFLKAKEEEEVRAFRKGCAEVIHEALRTARSEKEEYDSLSPTLKAKLGAFPTKVYIPLADFADVFEGVQKEQIPVLLRKLNYTLGKRDADKLPCVIVPFTTGEQAKNAA